MTMVTPKIGTKSWSENPPSEVQRNSEGKNLNSAQDLAKLGGQDVGEILNKIADPNYVDPAKRMRTAGSDKMDKDAFMKMMLAQMKNQDPTNPLKSHEMASQLAQFSSLEQLQNVNTTLNEIQKGQKPSESFQALNFIGKAVSGDSAKVIRLKGDKEHEFGFSLPDNAKNVNIKVRNAEGEVVRKIDLQDLKKGENKWVWNGKNEAGNSTPVGEYQFVIEARNDKNKLAVKTDFHGLISGVSYTAEGPVLLVGNQTVKLKDVKRIMDPSIKNNDQKSTKLVAPDLKTGQGAAENKENSKDAGAQEAEPTSAMMTNVGMSSGMMEKLKNETTPTSSTPEARVQAITPKLIPEVKTEKVEADTKSDPARKASLRGNFSTGGRT
jgi:flagellar basal-body rod modification protein FlgD